MQIGLTLMLLGGLASQPASEPDAGGASEVTPHCVGTLGSAEQAVRSVFAELADAYRDQLPGPRGESIRVRRIDLIVRRTVDVDEFAEKSLGRAWEEADAALRERWHEALGGMLEKRYWVRLRDPTSYRMTDVRGRIECDHATVRVTLVHSEKPDRRHEVSFALVHRAPVWRLYDVSVDGTSLLQTWRGRFRRIFLDGGLEELDKQMRGLRKRYPCPKAGCMRGGGAQRKGTLDERLTTDTGPDK